MAASIELIAFSISWALHRLRFLQSIVNLIFPNGIPDSLLIHFMEHGLLLEISPLLEWNKLHLMVSLWDVLSVSALSGTRTQRLGTFEQSFMFKGT